MSHAMRASRRPCAGHSSRSVSKVSCRHRVCNAQVPSAPRRLAHAARFFVAAAGKDSSPPPSKPARGSRAQLHADLQRRGALALLLTVPSLSGWAPTAKALIPDEEDEELLEKAKANRRSRLVQQKATTREFVRDEGLRNVKLSQDLLPVQKAVIQLARSGTQLEGGDLQAVTDTLSGTWLDEFKRASSSLNGDSDALGRVLTGIEDLRAAAAKGDVTASKRRYLTVVGAVQTWATDAGVSTKLKGL